MAKKEINWLAIERDYCAGVIPLDALCEKHSISLVSLQNYVSQKNLSRGDFIEDKKQYLQIIEPEMVKDATLAGKSIQEVFTPDELEKAALITASAMVEMHRGEFNRARRDLSELASWVMASKKNLKVPAPEASVQEHGAHAKIQNLMLTSYNSYVGGLMRIIQMERQTYNLDTYADNGKEDSALEQQNNLLSAMNEELKELMNMKSAYTGDDKTIYESEPHKILEDK